MSPTEGPGQRAATASGIPSPSAGPPALEAQDTPAGGTREERPTFDERPPVDPLHAERVAAQCLDPASPLAEEFRLLRSRVRALDGLRPLRTVGVVSTGAGEGRSTVALGLASALAWERRSVLLVEGDLRARGLERRLGLTSGPGLIEWLQTSRSPIPVHRLGRFGPCVLPAGVARLDETELFASPRMIELVEASRRSFDWVVVDAGPLLGSADTIALQDVLDGFLCVVRAGTTPKARLRRALTAVKAECVRGMVLNDHREFFTRSEAAPVQGRLQERRKLDSRGRESLG